MLGLALRATLLDSRIYADIRDRDDTMFSALGIVLIAAVAFGLGIWNITRVPGEVGFRLDQNLGLLVAVSTTFTSWFVWSIFIWLLGRVLFGGSAGYRETVRAVGVCYLPVALLLFVGLQYAAVVLVALGGVWPLASVVVATKHTHEFAWWKAIISAGVGWFWGMIVIPTLFVIAPLWATTSAEPF